MRKVLFVHHGTGVGGAPISMIETIKSLDQSRYAAEVLLLKDSVVREMLGNEGIKVSVASGFFYKKIYRFFPHIEPEYFKWWQLSRLLIFAFIWLMSRCWYSFRLLRKYEYDILHLNSSVLTDFLCAGHERGRVVIHIREPVAKGYFGFRLRFIRSQINRWAESVIAISEDNAKRLGCLSKTTVVYNFTEINPFPRYDFNEGKFALYVGGGNLIKGYLAMVGSLDYLDKDIKVIFCGYYKSADVGSTGLASRWRRALLCAFPVRRSLDEALSKMKCHPNAIVLGVRDDIPELLKKCRVLVSPFSVAHFSRPIVEAFANGRCVIGTDVEGMDELVDENVNGLIVPKDAPFELANAINLICADTDLSMRMGLEGYRKAQECFSRLNVLKIQHLYDAI